MTTDNVVDLGSRRKANKPGKPDDDPASARAIRNPVRERLTPSQRLVYDAHHITIQLLKKSDSFDRKDVYWLRGPEKTGVPQSPEARDRIGPAMHADCIPSYYASDKLILARIRRFVHAIRQCRFEQINGTDPWRLILDRMVDRLADNAADFQLAMDKKRADEAAAKAAKRKADEKRTGEKAAKRKAARKKKAEAKKAAAKKPTARRKSAKGKTA